MKPAARVQAAIEILGAVLAGAAADRALQAWGRAHRFAGSGDRRAIAAHVYAALRHGAAQEDEPRGGPPSGPAAARAALIAGLLGQGLAPDEIAALFDGGPHAPASLSDDERRLLSRPAAPPPPWLAAAFARAFGNAKAAEAEWLALARRAPLDLRINTLKTTRAAAEDRLAAESIMAEPPSGVSAALPAALRVLAGAVDVDSSEAYAAGLVEIQDAGSQIAAALCDARPGHSVLDLCAGAGGKSLALAAAMQNTGRLLAADTAAIRLKRLTPRAARAGVGVIETRLLPEDWLDHPPGVSGPFTETFDRVVVDAPCSGSGTWRRNPETRARLREGSVAILAALQARLLDAAAPLVAEGGRLIYITCSLLPQEGEDVVLAFLARNPSFAPQPIPPIWESVFGTPAPPGAGVHLRLSPAANDTDGFFVTVLAATL